MPDEDDDSVKSLVITPTYVDAPLSADPAVAKALVGRVVAYSVRARSANTLRAYEFDWKGFQAWCGTRGMVPERATPVGVAAYLAWLADNGFRYSTIQRAYAGISHHLRDVDRATWASGRRPLEIEECLRGIANAIGIAPEQKRPLTQELLREAVAGLDGESVHGLRDRTLLLLGFYGAFRRSELVALDREDIVVDAAGLTVRLRRSKVDQQGEGYTKGVFRQQDAALCPVASLRSYVLAARGALRTGPIFRVIRGGQLTDERLDARVVAAVVKSAAQRVGLAPEEFAGHSLRAGFATSAALAGVPEEAIAKQTGHRSREQLGKYIRRATVFQANATDGLSEKTKKK